MDEEFENEEEEVNVYESHSEVEEKVERKPMKAPKPRPHTAKEMVTPTKKAQLITPGKGSAKKRPLSATPKLKKTGRVDNLN